MIIEDRARGLEILNANADMFLDDKAAGPLDFVGAVYLVCGGTCFALQPTNNTTAWLHIATESKGYKVYNEVSELIKYVDNTYKEQIHMLIGAPCILNKRCIKLALAFGFKVTGLMPESFLKNGTFHGIILLARLVGGKV